MKATFHVSPEQLGPEGKALRDKEFLNQLRETISGETRRNVCFRHASPDDVEVAFEIVTNVTNPLPVLIVEVNGLSYEGNDRYSIDLRQMAGRLCVMLDQNTDIATRLPDCQLVLRLSVEGTINFGSLLRA